MEKRKEKKGRGIRRSKGGGKDFVLGMWWWDRCACLAGLCVIRRARLRQGTLLTIARRTKQDVRVVSAYAYEVRGRGVRGAAPVFLLDQAQVCGIPCLPSLGEVPDTPDTNVDLSLLM